MSAFSRYLLALQAIIISLRRRRPPAPHPRQLLQRTVSPPAHPRFDIAAIDATALFNAKCNTTNNNIINNDNVIA